MTSRGFDVPFVMPKSVRTTRTSLHSSLMPEKSASSPWPSSSQSESVVVGAGSFAFSFSLAGTAGFEAASFGSGAGVEAGLESGVLGVERRPARNPPIVPTRRRARVALYSWAWDIKDILMLRYKVVVMEGRSLVTRFCRSREKPRSVRLELSC